MSIIGQTDSNGIYYEYNGDQYDIYGNQASARIIINEIEYFGLYTPYLDGFQIYMFDHITSLQSEPVWNDTNYLHYIIDIKNGDNLYATADDTATTDMFWSEKNYFYSYHIGKKNPIILKNWNAGNIADSVSYHTRSSFMPKNKDTYKLKGAVRIYTENGWKIALPFIYTSEGWKQTLPYIFNNDHQWRLCGDVNSDYLTNIFYTANEEIFLDANNNKFLQAGG